MIFSPQAILHVEEKFGGSLVRGGRINVNQNIVSEGIHAGTGLVSPQSSTISARIKHSSVSGIKPKGLQYSKIEGACTRQSVPSRFLQCKKRGKKYSPQDDLNPPDNNQISSHSMSPSVHKVKMKIDKSKTSVRRKRLPTL